VAAMTATSTANIINSLTSKTCPSFLFAEPAPKDVNVSFPNTQQLSRLVFKPLQNLHRFEVKQIAGVLLGVGVS